MTSWTLEDAAALSLMWNFFQMTVNKNQVPMVINTPFHIFSSNSKKFQLIESQPTTNNARSAIFGAPGHRQPLIKMQRISIRGPKYRFFLQNFFCFLIGMGWNSYKYHFNYMGKEGFGYNFYFAWSGIFDKILKCHFWK